MPTKTKRDEEKWKKAEEIAAGAGKAKNYAYIMGIYKKMKPDYEFKSGPESKKASPSRVAARYLASRRGMPSEVASSVLLKRQGLTPVDEFFGEAREHNRPTIRSGEGVQDRRGKVLFFVGLDIAGKAILADTERELKTLHKQLVEDRKHVVVAMRVPDDIENDILDAAFTAGIKARSPISVEIEAVRGEIIIGLNAGQGVSAKEIDKTGRKMLQYLKKEGYKVTHEDDHLNIDTD